MKDNTHVVPGTINCKNHNMAQQGIQDSKILSGSERSIEFYFSTLNQVLTIFQFTDLVHVTVNLVKRELCSPEAPVPRACMIEEWLVELL